MELPETVALRHFVEQYLAGHETPETVAPAYIHLVTAYYEANFQATRRGEPAGAEGYLPPNITKAQLRRMLELGNAMSDLVPSPIEWLPLDEEDAV